MMPKTIQRTVAFYWLRLRSREAVSYRPVEDVDWESRLADLDSMKWQEKAIDGIRYDAILGKEYPILSVSEQFDPTFMQYIDRENERVTDYMDNYLAGERGDLAKSSAFAFFPEYALIGRISGSAGKSSEPLKKALDHYWSPGGEFEWDVQPVVTVDSIERFERELKELSSFTAGFTTRRYLDSTAQEGGKTGEFYREMADAIGTDLDVEIKVSIPKDGFFPSAGRKLKGTVSDLVAFAVKQNKQMQVSGTDLAGKLLELNLVSHPVVEQEDIIIGENEPRQFTNLIDHLVKVCTEKQTYLYEISRGAWHEQKIDARRRISRTSERRHARPRHPNHHLGNLRETGTGRQRLAEPLRGAIHPLWSRHGGSDIHLFHVLPIGITLHANRA